MGKFRLECSNYRDMINAALTGTGLAKALQSRSRKPAIWALITLAGGKFLRSAAMADATGRRADAGYSGIRPKIVPPAVAVQDFLIQGPRDHGVGGLINLFGIESPGLTSSLAIAEYVAELAGA
jgi:hypothetical protein